MSARDAMSGDVPRRIVLTACVLAALLVSRFLLHSCADRRNIGANHFSRLMTRRVRFR